MKYNSHMNRFQKKANREQMRQASFHGEGLYVYKNITKGTLNLPKATASGKKTLEEGEEFQGDDYFMQLTIQKMNPPMLKYIRCITASVPQELVLEQKETVMEEKLILDQPDKITKDGKVEHVVAKPNKPLNESKPKQMKPDVLINEDPLEGVEIILG